MNAGEMKKLEEKMRQEFRRNFERIGKTFKSICHLHTAITGLECKASSIAIGPITLDEGIVCMDIRFYRSPARDIPEDIKKLMEMGSICLRALGYVYDFIESDIPLPKSIRREEVEAVLKEKRLPCCVIEVHEHDYLNHYHVFCHVDVSKPIEVIDTIRKLVEGMRGLVMKKLG